jgi:peroxiredoxin
MTGKTIPAVQRVLLMSVGVALCAVPAQSQQAARIKVKLTPAPQAAQMKQSPGQGLMLPYYPIPIALSETKPASVQQEPAYIGKPKYGAITLGNGPNREFAVVIDQPEQGEPKVYVDKNRNGNLTDDGDGVWTNKSERNGTVSYGIQSFVLRASYGTDKSETSNSEYGVGLYYFPNRTALFMMREGARTGTLTLGGKKVKVYLVENDANALYDKPVPTNEKGEPTGKITTRPVWLVMEGEANKLPATIDIRAPFRLGEQTYEATVTQDGSQLTLTPTRKAVAQLAPKQAPRPALLTAGTVAPEFTVLGENGNNVSLADFRGKVIILDFWATWCGPCQRSMPHLQKVYETVKDKGIVVLALCVWDEKADYDSWLKENKSKYGFTFAFDPAGRGENNIAAKLYKVSGIPTTYIIDKEGKVAEAVVGYSGDDDRRIEAALKKVGVEIASK